MALHREAAGEELDELFDVARLAQLRLPRRGHGAEISGEGSDLWSGCSNKARDVSRSRRLKSLSRKWRCFLAYVPKDVPLQTLIGSLPSSNSLMAGHRMSVPGANVVTQGEYWEKSPLWVFQSEAETTIILGRPPVHSLGSPNLAGYLSTATPSSLAWLLADATTTTPSASSLRNRLPGTRGGC